MTAFEEFGVLPEIGKAVEEMGWTLPTDVQSEAIPLILGGGDVLMAAETGSGKTGAFCLPVLQITWEALKDLQKGLKGGDGAGPSAGQNDWAMSVHDRSPTLAIAPDGLRCQSRHMKEWHGVRATKGVASKGRWYFEASVEDEGLCRVGWATSEAVLDLGTCPHGFGFGGTGKKSNSKQFDDYGNPFGKKDVLGCYLDLDNMEIAYTLNGADLGLAFSIKREFKGKPFFPAVVLKNAEMSFNFGDSEWKFPPVDGFVGISSASDAEAVPNPKSGGGAAERKLVANSPQALIIEPSRELAEQTLNQIVQFRKHLDQPLVRELLVVGGVSVQEQVLMKKAIPNAKSDSNTRALRSGVDIVVATPGRLEDLISTGQMSLKQCRFFILDEADGLLKAGYEQLINRMHSQIPKMTSDGTRLQMIVCSATLHDFDVKKMAERLMHFPVWIDLKGQDSVPETVHHVVCHIDPRKDQGWKTMTSVKTDGVHYNDRMGDQSAESLSEAVKLLKHEYCLLAIRQHRMDYGMIFCRTKLDCDNMEKFLRANGKTCVCLHGDRKPQERKANLQAFKEQKVNFLICTDVASRGLDVKNLPFMINVNLPEDKANYVHRIGRVGRAERMGLAITLVALVKEKVWYHGQWCRSRGRNCYNTELAERGCCVWNEDLKFLADIEDHLGITVQEIGKDMKVELNEFDGKVVYGKKRIDTGTGYKGHAGQLAPTLSKLQDLETKAQLVFLNRAY